MKKNIAGNSRERRRVDPEDATHGMVEPLAHHSQVILHEMGQNDRKTFEGEGGQKYVAVWKYTPATPAPKGVRGNMGSLHFSQNPRTLWTAIVARLLARHIKAHVMNSVPHA